MAEVEVAAEDAAAAASKPARRVLLRRHTTGVVTLGDTGDLALETAEVEVRRDGSKQFLKHSSVLFAGGVAGSVGKTVTAPLSRLTILYQVHSMVSTRHSERFSPSLRGAFVKVLRNEGLLALWKGNGASVLHRFPYSAVNFLTFETVKSTLVSQGFQSITQNAWMTTFLAGAIAGANATLTCYPIDLIRTRLATQLDSDIRYHGIIHAARRIRAEEGFFGLYRGLGATLVVTVPNLAINFTIYESAKIRLKRFHRSRRVSDSDDSEASLSVVDTLCCGGLAGISSSLVTFPVDVVRRRLQISAIHAGSLGIAPTPASIALELFRTQGIPGFYRGLAPELLKVVPMVGITFGAFERLKSLLAFE